jgi:PfaB family protein
MANQKNLNLAITGLGIAGNSFSGLDQYGFEIFRGIPCQNTDQNVFSVAEKCLDVMRHLLEQSKTTAEKSKVVVINTEITEILQNSGKQWAISDLSSQPSPLETALVSASQWLENKEADSIILLDMDTKHNVISGAALCLPQYAVEREIWVLGVLDGLTAISRGNNLSAVESTDAQFDTMGLLLVPGPLPEFFNSSSLDNYIQSFPRKNVPSCALSESSCGLASVVKLIWCLDQKVIPGTNNWSQTEVDPRWENSIFYVPTESRTWFLPSDQSFRTAGLITQGKNEDTSLLVFKASANMEVYQSKPLLMESLSMYLFAGNSVEDIQQQVIAFGSRILPTSDISSLARDQFHLWENTPNASLTACILGRSHEELNREIEFASKGISEAAAKNTDWRTPMGSYFSPQPLGKTGSISFVYPGAFNSYPGVGKDLFYLFPSLYPRLSDISSNIGALLNETKLYPRSITKISTSDLDLLEKQLTADPLAMLISGTSLAALYTFLLREVFEIHPTSSFGYSLGEISVMFSSGVWTKGDETGEALRKSPLFRTRLAGPQFAIRDYWKRTENFIGLPNEKLWANFVLMAAYENVVEAVKQVTRVYVTHINTPRQVVIGGDPDGCRKVIEILKCRTLEAPFNYALHCEAMESEYESLRQLLNWPVQNDPGMQLFSAATHNPMPITQDGIAQQIAFGLCHILDFPHLVHTAYADGARIFIELGAGSNCARWVDDSLQGQPHASFSINRKGVDDHTAIIQLLAKMICHQVSINLSPVFD